MTLSLVLFLALTAGLVWLLVGGRGTDARATGRGRARDDIDAAELEQAERDVRDAADEDDVRDWGPGTAKPPS